MQLFLKQTKNEDESYPRGSFLSFGKCYMGKEYDGWYIKIETPFKQTKDHIDPRYFLEKQVICQYMMVVRHRPKYPWTFFKTGVWVPV